MQAIGLLALFLVIIAIGISAFVFVAAAPIIYFLYGEHYAAASDVLRIHIFSTIPLFLGVAQSLWIVNERKGRIILYKTAAGAALSVFLNAILIPLYGINAAACAAIMTQFAASVLTNFIWDKEYFKIQIKIFTYPMGMFSLAK